MEDVIKHNENLISIKGIFNRLFFYQLLSKYCFNNFFSYMYSSYNEYLLSKEDCNYIDLEKDEQFVLLSEYNHSVVADILEASFHNYQFFKIILSQKSLSYHEVRSIKAVNKTLEFHNEINFFFYKSVENDVLWILKDKNIPFPDDL
ncbi:hypothetical protein [Paenimyroides ummariense]|nr:hypothetical protein [Paenimyroides ummariense]